MADPVRPEEIEAIVAAFEATGCAELHIRFEGFELHLSGDPATSAPTVRAEARAPAPAADTPARTPAAIAPAAPADDLAGLEIVRAPYLGTFYRAAKPGEAPFVELGATVGAESDLCLVEVMKLFTAVRAGVAGSIARILATDGDMVEAGQPLFAIAAAG